MHGKKPLGAKDPSKTQKWTGRDLNPRPLPCQGSDLPADLPARTTQRLAKGQINMSVGFDRGFDLLPIKTKHSGFLETR